MEENKYLSIPWRKDAKLLEEAKRLFKERIYENESIFFFGFQLGRLYAIAEYRHLLAADERAETLMKRMFEFFKGLNLAFRSPTEYPDAILYREDTGEVANVEFEAVDSMFEEHGHDPTKCDLIVCLIHDKDWKNPITVYELRSGKFILPRK